MLQLIYASAATVRFSVADLKHLLAIARANNESLGVSGMLVFQEGSFLQIIEGEDDAVLEGARQHLALAARKSRNGRAGGEVLRRDHLAEHAAGGVRRGHEHGIEIELARRDDLKVSKQRIA